MNTTGTSPAYKEWSGICSVMETGLQALLLRKGGIAEEHGKFSFHHSDFYLFPTYFHQQETKTRLPSSIHPMAKKNGAHSIRLKAKVIQTTLLHDWEKVQALAPFHFWTEEVIRERFTHSEASAIHLAIVRIYRIEPEILLPDTPEYGGCKSWIEIPTAEHSTTPVIPDGDFQTLTQKIQKALA